MAEIRSLAVKGNERTQDRKNTDTDADADAARAAMPNAVSSTVCTHQEHGHRRQRLGTKTGAGCERTNKGTRVAR